MKKIIFLATTFLLFLFVAVMGFAVQPMKAIADENSKADILYLEYYVDSASPNRYTFYVHGDFELNNPQNEYNAFAAGIIVNGEKDGLEVSYSSHEIDFPILDGLDLYFQNTLRLFLPVGTKSAPDELGMMTSGIFDKITSITIESGFNIRTGNCETRTAKTFIPTTGYIDEETASGAFLISKESCTVEENAPEFEMGFLTGKYYNETWVKQDHHYLFEIDFADSEEFSYKYQLGMDSRAIPRNSVIINEKIDICDIDALFYSSEPYRENRISLYIYPNRDASQKYDLSKIESIEFKKGFNFMENGWRSFREAELKKDYKFISMSAFNLSTDNSIPFYLDSGKHAVVFYGLDNLCLDVQYVSIGDNATAPKVPDVENYHFVRWDKTFDNIQGVTHVYAVYEKTKQHDFGCNASITYSVMSAPMIIIGSIIVARKGQKEE